MNLLVRYLDTFAGEPLAYASQGAAGLDLPACIGGHVVPAGGELLIPTGVAVAIPDELYGQVVMRSGHGIKRSLSCHVGTIDSDYRGEIKVLVRNHGAEDQVIEPGERFAQLVIQPCPRMVPVEVHELPVTTRGDSGFGSTGY